ncbi:hypothetical protein GIX45_04060 [Erwinia sp. CPCC 100877]|nr:hypothetical protein [Erwinia sp. CPCC 100877]
MELVMKGASYRIAKLSVFEQLKVARKLLPLLAELATDFREAQEDPANVMEHLLPKIAEAISGMSEEDCDAIIHPCLGVVSREHMQAWVPVFTHGSLAFDDICLMTMLQLVARVVADSLGNFLQELPGAAMSEQPAA